MGNAVKDNQSTEDDKEIVLCFMFMYYFNVGNLFLKNHA